jgi:hypothetical protein
MAQARVKVGTFTWDSGASPKVVTGVGFQPKALVIFSPLMTTLDTWAAEAHMAMGIASSASNDSARRMVSGWDNVAFFTIRDNEGELATNVILYEISAFGTLLTSVALTAIGSDGFTLTPTLANANSTFGYIAFGGDDVTASVGTTNWSTSAAAQSVNAGLAPTLVMFQAGGDGTTQCWSQGWCDAAGRNGVTSFSARSTWPTPMNTDVKSYQTTASALVVHHPTTGAIAGEASAVLTPTGFDLNWSTVYGTAGTFRWLALAGFPAHVVAIDQPSATGAQTITGLDVDPSAVFFQSACVAAGSGIQNELRFAYGMAEVGAAFGAMVADNDNTAWAAQRTVRHLDSKPIALGHPTGTGTGTLDARADLASVGSGRFALTWTQVDATPRQVIAVALGGYTETDFGTLAQQSGEVIGLTWAEVTHVDANDVAHTYLWAPVDLIDPSTYYGGFKDGRVLGFGQIRRGLSDKHGQYESSEWSWVQSDTDRLVRGMMGNQYQRTFTNRMALARMIDDAGRRLLKKPRLLVRGVIRDVKPRAPLLAEFICKDFLASHFGAADLEKQIPQRTLTRVDFPDMPIATIGAPVPIVYGGLSDEGSVNPPPVLTGDPAIGAYWDGLQVFGFAPITNSAAAVPTGVTVGSTAGGTIATDVPDAKYGVWVTAVDANGIETDPDCYFVNQQGLGTRQTFPANVQTVTVGAGEKIQVSWSAAAGAVKYRVYLGYYYYGAGPQQAIETASLSCEFTTSPSWNTPVTASNITPGAFAFGVPPSGPWMEKNEYAVSAIYADGETALSDFGVVWWSGYLRSYRVEWIAPTIAPLGYRVYRRKPYQTWDRMWIVPAGTTQFDDDQRDTNVTYITGVRQPSGALPLIYVGTVLDAQTFNPMKWHRFVVAGHAIKEITSIFQGTVRVDAGNYGVTFCVPGQTGYSTYFPNTGSPQYVDINGRRYTCIMVRGPQGDAAADGTQPLSVNVRGAEDAGDGSGALIDALADIYKHLVINWWLQSYQSGAWLTAPDWPTDVDGTIVSQVDEASFDALKALHNARLTGGYPGAIALGISRETLTLKNAIARMNLSCDCGSFFNRNSQFAVSGLDLSSATLAAAKHYDQANDTIAGSFDTVPDVDDIENVVVYSYLRRYAKTQAGDQDWDAFEQRNRDADAIHALRDDEREGPVVQLHAVRSAAVANDIMQRRLDFYKRAPVRVFFTTNLKALATEIGDVITTDHIAGLATGGWSAQPLRVLRHVVNPSNYTVTLECHDLGRLYDGTLEATLAWMTPVAPSLVISKKNRLLSRRRRRPSETTPAALLG